MADERNSLGLPINFEPRIASVENRDLVVLYKEETTFLINTFEETIEFLSDYKDLLECTEKEVGSNLEDLIIMKKRLEVLLSEDVSMKIPGCHISISRNKKTISDYS